MYAIKKHIQVYDCYLFHDDTWLYLNRSWSKIESVLVIQCIYQSVLIDSSMYE